MHTQLSETETLKEGTRDLEKQLEAKCCQGGSIAGLWDLEKGGTNSTLKLQLGNCEGFLNSRALRQSQCAPCAPCAPESCSARGGLLQQPGGMDTGKQMTKCCIVAFSNSDCYTCDEPLHHRCIFVWLSYSQWFKSMNVLPPFFLTLCFRIISSFSHQEFQVQSKY